jgi:hypothetical protein
MEQVDEDMSAECRLDNLLLLLNAGESKPGLENTKEVAVTENEGKEHWQAPRNAQKRPSPSNSLQPTLLGDPCLPAGDLDSSVSIVIGLQGWTTRNFRFDSA